MTTSAGAKLVANKIKLHRKDLQFGAQICTICILWWTSSSGRKCKTVWLDRRQHKKYPYPLTIALSSCLNNVLYAIPLVSLLSITPVKVPFEYLLRTVVPISIGRALAITSAYFALWKISVSYSQTIKSTMPLFTVLISRILLGERQTLRVYLSLLPIVVGVFIATATELQFDTLGLCSSLLSTGIFAFLNVLAKKVFDETGMHPINLLSLNSQLASLLLFPFWLLTDARTMLSELSPNTTTNLGQKYPPDLHFLYLLLLSGLCSFFQNACAFLLIFQLSTLSYSVTNTAKRIFVIALSLITLHNPVTPLNVCGMLLSILGVFFYSKMKSRPVLGDRRHPPISPPPADQHQQSPQFRRQSQLTQQHILTHNNSDVRLILANE